ncbi:MAG: heme exporter protein CcmB [Coxiellaceae bacterium]|nr:MAG: heme exporter protein CcmB [Coxiellaceae bacterium]
MQAFCLILKRDLLLMLRQRSEILLPLGFFLIIVTLFAIVLSDDLSTLERIAPGIIWIAALLANLMALDGIYRNDFEDGSLEQLLINPYSLSGLMLAKIMAHWLLTGLPLLLLLPLASALFHLSAYVLWILFCSLLLGTLIFSLLGAIIAALIIGLRRSSVLLAILLLPLYLPVLVFGLGAVMQAIQGLPIQGALAMLAGLFCLALTFAPWAAAAALRISLSE